MIALMLTVVPYLEWLYIISGTGRATAFAGSSSARTFDFQVSFDLSWARVLREADISLIGWGHGRLSCLLRTLYAKHFTHPASHLS